MNLHDIAFGAWLLVKSQLLRLEKRLSPSANFLWKTNEKIEGNNCIWQNAYYLRCFSVPWVLRRPTDIDHRRQVISGFCSHLRLTDTVGLDLMLVSIWSQAAI